jgi:hypothetical protein
VRSGIEHFDAHDITVSAEIDVYVVVDWYGLFRLSIFPE